MLKGSRVSRSLDTGRMARALRRPGIDPRMHCAIAIVRTFFVDQQEQAPFVDVALLHEDPPLELCVRVAPFYAGPSFGFFAEYEADDEVVVVFPDGRYDHGGYVIGRAWSPSDPMPAEVLADPSKVWMRIKQGKTYRILAGDDVALELTPDIININGSVAATKVAQLFGIQGQLGVPPGEPGAGQFFFDMIAQHFVGGIAEQPPLPQPDQGAIGFDPSVDNTDSSGVLVVSCPQNQSSIGKVKFAGKWNGPKPPKVTLTPCDAGAQAALTLVPPQIVIVDPATVTLEEFAVTVGTAAAMAAAPLAPARYAYKVEG